MVATHTLIKTRKTKHNKKKLQGYPLTAMHNRHIFRCAILHIVQLLLTNYENNENNNQITKLHSHINKAI